MPSPGEQMMHLVPHRLFTAERERREAVAARVIPSRATDLELPDGRLL